MLLRPRHYLRTINSQNFPLESCSRLDSSPLPTPRPTPKRSSIFCETSATQISRIRFRFEVISINSGSVKWAAWSSVESYALCSLPLTPRRNSSRACFQFLRSFTAPSERDNVNEIKTFIVRISRIEGKFLLKNGYLFFFFFLFLLQRKDEYHGMM